MMTRGAMLVIECWNGPARLFPLYVRTGALLYTIHIIKKWSVTNVVITNVQWSNNKVMLAAWERRSPLYSLSLRLPYSRLTNLLFTKWHRRKLAGGAPSCRSRRRWIPLLPWTFFSFHSFSFFLISIIISVVIIIECTRMNVMASLWR